MFTWICPQCGREVPPAYNECPDCTRAGTATPGTAQPGAAQPQQAQAAQPQPGLAQQPWQQPQAMPAPPAWQAPPPPPQQSYAPAQPQQSYAPPGYPPQQQGYPPQGYPPQGYAPPQQGYPPQGYAPQGYAPPQQGYPPQQPYAPPQQPYPAPETPPQYQQFWVPPAQQPAQAEQPAPQQPQAPAQQSAPPPQQQSPAQVEFRSWEAPPPTKRRVPTWLMTIGFAVVFLGIVAGIYGLVGGFRSKGPSTPTAAVESPAAKPGAKTNPIQKFIEVSGVRFTEEGKKKVVSVKYLIVNHSGAEINGLAGNVTVWGRTQKSEEDAAGTFSFQTSLGPYESKELTSPLNTKLKIYELPDWQNVSTDIQVTAPGAG